MKISELIEQLETIKAKEGDLHVFTAEGTHGMGRSSDFSAVTNVWAHIPHPKAARTDVPMVILR